MTDLIDRAALVATLRNMLASLEANPDVSKSYLNGFGLALSEVQHVARVPAGLPPAKVLAICAAQNRRGRDDYDAGWDRCADSIADAVEELAKLEGAR